MLQVAVGVGAFALTAALTVATGGTAMLVAGTAIGALQGGINSYLDQRNSGFKTDWATVGKEAFKGGVISGIAGGIGGAAAKTLTPLNFCGKTATEKFVQVAEHRVVGTVSDGATGIHGTGQRAAIYDTGITAEYGDELITLSTCSYHTTDGRFVGVAKKMCVQP